MSSENLNLSEERLRLAFARLKANKPLNIAKGSPVNETNVALEAGYKSRSIMRKDRFPTLVMEVQAYAELHQHEKPPSQRQKILKRRKKNRENAAILKEARSERDQVSSQLLSANRRLVEFAGTIKKLQKEIDRLRRGAS